jgi:hypothetical protein
VSKRITLPEPGEPLETSRGNITPISPGVRRVVEVPSASEAVRIIEGTRRKLAELPVTPKSMNPVAVVCIYTMYGLSADEISIATGIPTEQVHRLRMTNEYALIQRGVVDNVLQADSGEVKDYITKAAGKAARKVESLVDSPFPDVALRAAKDVLDRAGLAPAMVHEMRSKMDVGLTIEVIDRRDEQDRPIIDLQAEE